jgi:hypothetical protein
VIGASGCTGFGRDSSGWVSAYYWRRSRVIVWLPVSCRSASDRPRRSPHRAGWWCSTTRALDLRCRPPMSPSRQIPQALLSRANVPSPYAHGADRARTGTPANRAPDRGPRRRPRCPPLVDYGPLAADTGYPQRAETAQLARDCLCNLGVPDCTSPMATKPSSGSAGSAVRRRIRVRLVGGRRGWCCLLRVLGPGAPQLITRMLSTVAASRSRSAAVTIRSTT